MEPPAAKEPLPTKILLIEDDETDFMWIERALGKSRHRRFELKRTKTLEEGLSFLNKAMPDFVICDLGLPDASGLQSYEAVRKNAHDVPVVVLTGNASDENLGRQAVKQGAQDYLIKGVVTPDGLLRAIDYAIERKRALLLRDQFVHMVSHELRNPLGVLKEVVAQLIEFHGTNLTKEQKELIELAQKCIQRLIRTTSDLLDVAKMESERVPLQITSFDFIDLVKELSRFFESVVKKKGLALEVLLPQGQALIQADRDAIARCITNLLNNAVKYTEKGFIKIIVSETATHWQCHVADSGSGIAPGNMERIFNRYEQFGTPTSSAEKGVGLGLSLCKEIAERHGGFIEVQSKLHEGSTFTLNLPKQFRERKKLGEILVEEGLVAKETIEQALKKQAS